MSLLSRLVRSAPVETDEAVERHLARLRGQLGPDPLFRRRLRNHAINHYVAARERHEVREPSAGRSSRMGRIGRASLYASVAMAVSAATVLGVSQEALPGDALYGVKLRIEELRFDVAPIDMHPMLVALVIGERLDEMSRLVDAGRLDDAVALGPSLKREIQRLGEAERAGDTKLLHASRITCSYWTSWLNSCRLRPRTRSNLHGTGCPVGAEGAPQRPARIPVRPAPVALFPAAAAAAAPAALAAPVPDVLTLVAAPTPRAVVIIPAGKKPGGGRRKVVRTRDNRRPEAALPRTDLPVRSPETSEDGVEDDPLPRPCQGGWMIEPGRRAMMLDYPWNSSGEWGSNASSHSPR